MRARALAFALAAAIAAVPAGASARVHPLHRGANYLAGLQQPNGAFFDPDQPADATAETLASYIAAWPEDAPVQRALTYIRDHGPARAGEGAGFAGRLVMGIVAAGEDPRSFGGFDYVEALGSYYDGLTGAYDGQLYANALAALGVIAARGEVPARALDYIRSYECAGGGFAHARGCLDGSDADTTALCATVLASADRDDPAVRRARDALREMQNDDGGFGHRAGQPSDANSTGLAMSALVALGDDPAAKRWTRDRTPGAALLSFQASNGGFRYRAGQPVNAYATVQALPGLAHTAYPITARDPIVDEPSQRTPTGESPAVETTDADARGNDGQVRPAGSPDTSTRPKEPRPPVLAGPQVNPPSSADVPSRTAWIALASLLLLSVGTALVVRSRT